MTADQESALVAWLETQFCRSTGPIRAHIYAQFGLIYSHLGCVKLLHRLGFEYRKPKALPRVADEVKQADFIDFYESLLNTLPADEAVYFADAVNREYQSKPAFGWVKKGSNPAVKTTPGRGRVNIHGALCLENFDAPFIEPVTVNGNSAVQLLAKIEANNPNQINHSRHLGQRGLSQMRCRQTMDRSTGVPHTSHQASRILSTPEPHRAPLGRHARIRHPSRIHHP